METVTPSDLERVESKIGDVGDKVDAIYKLLNGNGTPGLLIRIDRMEQWQVRHDESQTRMGSDFRSLIMPLAVDALKASVAGGAFVVIGHALGILH